MCAHGGNEASGGIAVHSDWCGAFLVQQKTNEKCFLNTSDSPFVKQNLKKKKKCHNGQEETEGLGSLTVVLSADKGENVE